MFLTELKLNNFRNIKKLKINPKNLINYFYSPNGTGKTNLLEAIQCVTVGKTLRAKSENELLNFNSRENIYIHASFVSQENAQFTQTFAIENQIVASEAATFKKKKTLLINKTKTSINDFIGRVPSIWFSPESIKVITSSPKSKREYFDDVLIQLYPEYNFNLRNFNRALKQRNALLQDEYFKANQIRVWTEQLILYGAKIIKARQVFFQNLNTMFRNIEGISRYQFQIEYTPNITISAIFDEDAAYRYREELRRTYELDKRRASTNVGPHRDDWNMLIKIPQAPLPLPKEGAGGSDQGGNFIRADKFASRGQQRMSLIILQLVLIKMFEKLLDRKPILLLDDIFSELDLENEKILLEIIQQNQIQSFITGVEKKDFEMIDEFNIQELI